MWNEDRLSLSRRALIRAGGVGLTGVALGAAAPPPSPADVGRVKEGKVTFPNWRAPGERPEAPPPAPLPPEKRVGFALVGLGRLTLNELLPAFAECRKAKPVALVSGTPDKAKTVASQYGVKPEAVYDYAGFESIADNPEIQVVYVVLPNGLHRDFVLRAARAGKHVLCEKPMANNSAEARDMIAACAQAGRHLMIAYRCQYEPYNRAATRLARSGELGPVRLIEATNLQNMGLGDQWRFKGALAGGGALPDVGIYCLNAARYITGEEPIGVSAQVYSPPGDDRYREVEETVTFQLRFPSGVLANCSTSYGIHEARRLSVHTTDGAIMLENAFAYQGQRMRVRHRQGQSEADVHRELQQKNQFALEIDHMATCVLENRRPRTPGEEGLQDHILMEAIYEAARSGRMVDLPKVEGRDATRGPEPEEAS